MLTIWLAISNEYILYIVQSGNILYYVQGPLRLSVGSGDLEKSVFLHPPPRR